MHHRDPKPDSLFVRLDAPVIGDFGLVACPEKAPLTQPEERVGPMGFFALEIIQNTDQAECGPADVWALMKSRWVGLVGVEYPPTRMTLRPASHDGSGRARIARLS